MSAKMFLGNDSVRAYEAYSELLPSDSFRPDIVERAIQLFIRDLDRIISKAPPLDAPMVVYRGTSFDVFEGIEGRAYDVTAFVSTAFDLQQALRYAYNRKSRLPRSGLLQRITLSPGTRAIAVAMVNLWHPHGEYEVVLPRGRYEITNRSKERLVMNAEGKTHPMRVTDVVFRSSA